MDERAFERETEQEDWSGMTSFIFFLRFLLVNVCTRRRVVDIVSNVWFWSPLMNLLKL